MAHVHEEADPSSEEEDQDEGDTLMGFGKHSDKTYQFVATHDPSYWSWMRTQANPSGAMRAFLAWLDGEAEDTSSQEEGEDEGEGDEGDALMGFGKHKVETYRFVATLDPSYGSWMRELEHQRRQCELSCVRAA